VDYIFPLENNSESKDSSATRDSSKDSMEGSSQVELQQKATIHTNFDIHTWVPSFWTWRFSSDPVGLRLRVVEFQESSAIGDSSRDSTEGFSQVELQ